MSPVVAVCGKGGVGKTTTSAIVAAELRRQSGMRSLVVDADHAGGLAMALGLPVKGSINQLRKRTIEEIKSGGSDKRDLAMSIDYLLMEAVTESGPLAFLALGRPEEVGCYCSVNSLLRKAIELLASGFDFTLIDAEAGIEQVSRKVMSSVDRLVLVSDTSAKGLKVAAEIAEVARSHKPGLDAALLVNRLRPGEDIGSLALPAGVDVMGGIPDDDTVRDFDREGRSFFEMEGSPAAAAVIAALSGRGIL